MAIQNLVVQKEAAGSKVSLNFRSEIAQNYSKDYITHVNVQIKGYDFPILESYQRYLHSVAEYLDIDVSDCYALPPQATQVQRLRPNSAVVEAEYRLTVYERNLQINDVDAPVYPVFLRIAQAALPEGVHLCVQEHSDEFEERRYVPDRDLLDLKAELERMQSGGLGGPKKK
ncbi:unnamed protein product [Ceratitis capitata]|uniref:(Mediterranean fruit fly) hypothetical protein n=1 Tax=Ceratitis capitata TaxID=7213 RepID=A0A811ULY0_CERCA|nr:unnamed protein product [Ceratitis capitata]